MEMLNVTFNTSGDSLSVEPEYATPILAINTTSTGAPNTSATTPASFDPTQPWSVLNGAAFSRKLGWYDPNEGSPANILSEVQSVYGANSQIWIESVSQSPGLETYQAVGEYGVNSNNTTTVDPTADAYSPIFGAGGSSTIWPWDGMMDHNAYAVNLSDITEANQPFRATYELYIGDSNGNPIPAAAGASATTTWTWEGPATVPVPEPATWSLVASGLGLLGLFACRRKKS